MQLRYDEDFVEAAVFLCAGGRRKGVPASQIACFHRARERLYAIPDPDQRSNAFFELHLATFRQWGLEQPLAEGLSGVPLVRERLDTLAVRKSTGGRNDEGAELYVNETGQRTGLLAIRLERMIDPVQLRDFIRHEFTHLHDILDPAFGYSPALVLPGLNAAQKRLALERYRLLWDVTIDGRMARDGYRPTQTRDQHAAAFARGYSFWPERRQAEVFEGLWQGVRPHHSDLVALISDPRGLRDAHLPVPGASCPLCDFPTFHWAGEPRLTPSLVLRVSEEFPSWQPEQGICIRCLETYEASARDALAVVN